MQYVNLGNAAVKVSQLCLGCMSFGHVTDEKEADRIVRHALDLGVNFFDTAASYTEGKSEQYLGRAIANVRDQVVISTKFGCRQEIGEGINDRDSSRYHVIQAVETSLKRLGTDRIDLYILHMPHRRMNLEETLMALDHLVQQGKVLYIGCSNLPAWLVCKSLWISDVMKLSSFVCIQSVYNLIERGIEVETLPLCHAEGLGVMAYRALCRGILAGRYLPSEIEAGNAKGREWTEKFSAGLHKLENFAHAHGKTMAQAAIAWIITHPVVTCTIVGATRPQELDELVAALDWHLSVDDREELSSVFGTEMTEYDLGVHAPWRKAYDLLWRASDPWK